MRSKVNNKLFAIISSFLFVVLCFTQLAFSYGDISNAVTSTWEYDGQEGKYPDMIRLGTSQFYAIFSTGDSGTENDGYIRTIKVYDNNGTIQPSLVDSLEYDTTDGYAPSVCYVDGSDDIYAICYYDATATKETVTTVHINDADGQIDAGVIASLVLYNSVTASRAKIIYLTGTMYVVAQSLSDTDLWLDTVQITTAGALTWKASREIDTSDGIYPDMCRLDADTVAVVYDSGVVGTNDGYMSTWNISALGAITATRADFWEFDTGKGTTPTIARVTGNIFMVAYEDTNSDLYVKTCTILPTGMITKAFIDTQAIDTTNGDYPTFFNVSTNGANSWIKGITFSGEGSDGYVSTFDVDSTGAIGSEIDTLETVAADTVAWYMPACFVSGTYFLSINEDSANDGWAKTFTIDVPVGAPTNTAPTQSNPSPVNASTCISPKPQLAITVGDNEDATQNMNLTWSSNSSGSWLTFGTNSSISNGTYRQTNNNFSVAGQRYYWKVVLNDGQGGWDNHSYYFTVRSAPTVTLIAPTNGSSTVTLQPNCSVWSNQTCGGTVTTKFYTNMTGSWVLHQTNVTASNTTVQWSFTEANTANTIYYWKVVVNNSCLNTTTRWFKFTTRPDTGSIFLYPNAEGTTQQWDSYPVGTDWTTVDEVVADDDTSYVYTNIQGEIEEFNHNTSEILTYPDVIIDNVTLFARAKAVYSDFIKYTSLSDGHVFRESESYAEARGSATGDVVDGIHAIEQDFSVGQKNTSTWQNQTLGDVSFLVGSSWSARAGQKVNAFPESTITEVDFYLSKAGAPTGTGYVRVRSVADDSIIGTIGSINVATIDAGYAWYPFTTTPVPITVDTDVRIMFEYSGGDSGNYLLVSEKNANVISFGLFTYYDGSNHDNSSEDLTFRLKYYVLDVYRGFLFFDTSALPDTATITATSLKLYGKTDSSTTDFFITVQSGMPTYPHDPLVSGDFDMTNYAGDGGSLTTNGFSVAGYNTITLNSTGRGWISKTGTTKLCLRSGRDIGDANPTGNEYVVIYAADKADGYVPYLQVTFTVASPASINLGVKIGGTRYPAPSNNALTTSYADKTYTWDTNPDTGNDWEVTNITDLQSSLNAVTIANLNISIRCTQVHFILYYHFPSGIVFDINISAFGFGIVSADTIEYSNQTSSQYTMTVYNNGTVAIDVDVNGTNATATGVSAWVLSAANGNNQYTMELYNLTTGWWKMALTKATWYSNMPVGSIRANLRAETPTTFYSGKQMSCRIYMVASIH